MMCFSSNLLVVAFVVCSLAVVVNGSKIFSSLVIDPPYNFYFNQTELSYTIFMPESYIKNTYQKFNVTAVIYSPTSNTTSWLYVRAENKPKTVLHFTSNNQRVNTSYELPVFQLQIKSFPVAEVWLGDIYLKYMAKSGTSKDVNCTFERQRFVELYGPDIVCVPIKHDTTWLCNCEISSPAFSNASKLWLSLFITVGVICGVVCIDRLYSSCKRVYLRRTGRLGFSMLETFDDDEESDDEDHDIELSMMPNQSRSDHHHQGDDDEPLRFE